MSQALPLSSLVAACKTLSLQNPQALATAGNTAISAITSDSRAVKPGSIFVALLGSNTDGHQYLEKAIKQGAAAIVVIKDRLEQFKRAGLNLPETLPVFYAENTYKSLGELCSAFYGKPGEQLKLVGVTGTNGKTTVTHLIETILKHQKKSVGLIGTLGTKTSRKTSSKTSDESASAYENTGHTTPMAPELQEILATMRDANQEYVVMEVSSHALEQHRVFGCDFHVAVLTNLTQDHLDYHKTMAHYRDAKAMLFKNLQPENGKRSAVINLDSDEAEVFIDACPENVFRYTYSLNNTQAAVYVKDIQYSITGATFTVMTPVGESPVKLQLAGQFSVYNALAALASGIALEIPLKDCVKAIEEVPGVRGRFEVVSEKPFVIVDYAHTPDGLENILNAARQVTPTGGRLICVFGCGGDRDATKRPKMGRAVERLADMMLVTSDNPRSEDPQQIITDIISGIQRFDAKRMLVNADREQAIHQAIDLANPNDIIVVAGKGHEDYQILADRTIHFDDREVVQNYVKLKSSTNPVSA
ncbi:MAG: UDP-N-acetylmuramoyl-L-alanyl-D-glutamate--2,6-diaminopimelate ligase [Vampirovibrionales bacterium]|nr:UDP-N-acetylmuramoyl-L-alanyl-D-glutamate--2,6-diaminopimelate ligase [Vampirovibrionales bacterium]